MKYSGHRKLCEFRILNEHSGLQIPPRENWFQYVHRVDTTAISFPCIITLWKILFFEQTKVNRSTFVNLNEGELDNF